MFTILNFENFTSNPRFLIILATFFAALFQSISDFAPVQTIFPDPKMSQVALGFLSLIITPENLLELYSEFLEFKTTTSRSILHFKSTVATMF